MQHLRTITSMEEDFKALGLIPNDDGYNALVKDLTANIGQHNSLMAPLLKLEEDKNAELEAVKNATREAMKVRKSGNIQQASDLEKKRDEMIKKAKGLGYGQDAEDAATDVEGEQTEDAEGMNEAAEQSKEDKYAEAYRNFKTYSFDSEEDEDREWDKLDAYRMKLGLSKEEAGDVRIEVDEGGRDHPSHEFGAENDSDEMDESANEENEGKIYALVHLYGQGGMSYGKPQKMIVKNIEDGKEYVQSNVLSKGDWGEVVDGEKTWIYRKGEWSLATDPSEVKESRSDVLRDVMQLSSGTLATLTGKGKYEELDKIRHKFEQFVIGALDSDPNAYKSWQDAWKYFKDSYDLETLEPKQGEMKESRVPAYYDDIKQAALSDEAFDKENAKQIASDHNEQFENVLKHIKSSRQSMKDEKAQKENPEVISLSRGNRSIPVNSNMGRWMLSQLKKMNVSAEDKEDVADVLSSIWNASTSRDSTIVLRGNAKKYAKQLKDLDRQEGSKGAATFTESKEEDIAYETENFYAVKIPNLGYKIFQNGPTAAKKVATIGFEDIAKVKQEIARREELLAKEKNVSESKMNAVKVTYDNGDEVVTSINGSDEEVLNYFKVGKTFNIGNGGKDLMAKVVKAEIVPSVNESTDKFFIVYKDEASPFKKSSGKELVLAGFQSKEEAEKALPKWKKEYKDAYIVDRDPAMSVNESTELSEAIKAQRLKKMKPAAKAKARRAYRKQKSKISRKLKKLRKKPSYKRRKAKLKKLKKGKKAGARRRLVLAGLGNIGKLAEAILANASLLKEEKMTQEQFLEAFGSIENMANVMCKKYAALISMIEEDETDLDYVGQEWDELDDFQDEGDEVEADDEDLGHVGQEWDDLEDFEEPGDDVEDEYEDENDKEYVGDEVEESRNLMSLRCLIEDVRSAREHLANGKKMNVKQTISEMTQALAKMMQTYVQEAFAYVGDDEPEAEKQKPEAVAKGNKYVGGDEPNAEKQKPEAPLGNSKYVGEEPNAEKQKPVATLKGNKYVGKDNVDAEKAKPEAPKQNKYIGKDKPEEDNDKPAESESVSGKHVGEKPYGTAQAGKVIPTIK